MLAQNSKFGMEEIIEARKKLAELKSLKLVLVAEKHNGDNPTLNDLYIHFQDEVSELALAFRSLNKGFVMEELADISNLVDMLFAKVGCEK